MNHQLPALRGKLYAAVISDILDEMGFRSQSMDTSIRPLQTDAIVVGRARTMLSVPDFVEPEKPYANQIAATDLLGPGDVVVINTSDVRTSAFWGELFSLAATARGATGVIVDGYIRDTRKIIELGFPVFSRGMHPGNSRARQGVLHYDQPITCGGVRVNPGDYIFAELDGCMVIPAEIADEVFTRALEIAAKESEMKQALREGLLLRDAYARHRVL